MRRRVSAAAGLALVFSAAFASAALAGTRVYVMPGSGKPTTRFTLRFRAPDRTGSFGTLQRHYQLYVTGPTGRSCVSRVSLTMGATRRHARVRFTLNPRRLGGVWCAGRFHGRIAEITTIFCRKTLFCPQVIVAPLTVARFSFRVRKAPSGSGGASQAVGPTFAGLVSAATCSPVTPMRQVLPQARSYTLSWSAATDPVTPSAEIVYDIYASPISGGEDYSHPTWTTGPGATTYTGTLPGADSQYFVVRARDQAGLEDDNTVEHLAVNRC